MEQNNVRWIQNEKKNARNTKQNKNRKRSCVVFPLLAIDS